MFTLIDSDILVFLLHRADPRHADAVSALESLKNQGHTLVTSLQNIAEFWNVCTRPVTARNGLGLSVEETAQRLELLEQTITVLPDPPSIYASWKQLVLACGVQGVQVHDTRLVAWMQGYAITHLLTGNNRDFARFTGITAQSPAEILATANQ